MTTAPILGRRGATWAGLGLGAVTVGAGVALLPLPAHALLVAGLAYALVVVLIVRALDGAPLTPADHATLLRAAIACLLAGAAGGDEATPYVTLAILAAIAVVSDAVDGWLARRATPTAFGARFDMETDAALGLVLCALLVPVVGAWVVVVGVARYAFVAAGLAAPRLASPLPPSDRRRIACAVQTVALVVALALAGIPALAIAAAAVALGATAFSFAVDVAWLLRRR